MTANETQVFLSLLLQFETRQYTYSTSKVNWYLYTYTRWNDKSQTQP